MNGECENDLIDLGAATVETKGMHSGSFDQEAGLKLAAGLTDD